MGRKWISCCQSHRKEEEEVGVAVATKRGGGGTTRGVERKRKAVVKGSVGATAVVLPKLLQLEVTAKGRTGRGTAGKGATTDPPPPRFRRGAAVVVAGLNFKRAVELCSE